MSGILRFVIKRSVNQFRLNSLKPHDGRLLNRSPAYLNHLINFQFRTSHDINAFNSIEKFIKNLDRNARSGGRISLREVENVVHEMKALGTASGSQSLMVIRCCGNLIAEESPQKRTELVQETWRTFEKLGFTLDISHYNALLLVYLENEYKFKPTDILRELENKGIEPNRVTFQRLIQRYCEDGDMEGATKILQVMREKGMPINEVVFNSLLLGHTRSGDMKSAEHIVEIMQQADIDPTAETYTLLINGYIKEGNMNKVEELMKHCEMHEISFSDRDYLEMALHLAMNGQNIDQILSKVRRSVGYNNDVVIYVNRLINADKLDDAFKLLNTMTRVTRRDGTLVPSGNFFIVALVRYDKSLEKILKYCDILMNENLNPFALNTAMEEALKENKEELALNLFKAAKERNVPIRQHYFWPLIVQHAKKNERNLYRLLNKIKQDFDMNISTETLRGYVVPHLLDKNVKVPTLLAEFRSCGIGLSSALSAIVYHLLLRNKLREAAEIASQHPSYYSSLLIRRPLNISYLKSKDADSFTTMLRAVAAGIKWRAANLEAYDKSEEEEVNSPDYRNHVGGILGELVFSMRNHDDLDVRVQEILELMVEKGVGINSRTSETIKKCLQDKITPKISSLLTKLTDEDLPSPEQRKASKNSLRQLDVDTLERLHESAKSKGESLKGIQKELFKRYGRQHNLEKLLKLKEELDAEEFVFSSGMKALLLETLLENDKLDEAWETYKSYVNEEPDFKLSSKKILKLALALVKNEKYDDALQILRKKPMSLQSSESPDNSVSMGSALGWRILNHFAEKGDEDKVKEFFDLIIQNEFCTVNNILIGPLVKVHVIKDDFEGAIKEFERCCIKYRMTPWKSQLIKKCIEKEDAVNLQKIADLSSQIHGQENSLYDLMLIFLEEGRLKQAKKILETPGLRLRSDRLKTACQKYQNAGNIECLENLLAVTKDINGIDKKDLYYNLLLTYSKSGDAEKALSLWTQMQEDDEQPNDNFLILLADVLEKNNMSVPFEVPKTTHKLKRIEESDSRVEMSRTSIRFRYLLVNKSIEEALEYKKSQKPEQFNNTDLSLLMEKLLQQNRFEESKQVLKEILDRDALPLTRILKMFLIKAMLKGDVEVFELIGNKLTEDNKKMVQYNSRLFSVYKIAGRAEEYLKNIENQFDLKVDTDEANSLIKYLPAQRIVPALCENPKLVPIVQRIADKCLERDEPIFAPMSIMLLYNLMNKNYETVDKLWKEYFLHSNFALKFKFAVNYALKNQDLEILQKLQSIIEQKPDANQSALGIIYGGIIHLLVNKGQVESALAFLDEALKKVSINHIMRKGLESLEVACHAKEFLLNMKYRLTERIKMMRTTQIATDKLMLLRTS